MKKAISAALCLLLIFTVVACKGGDEFPQPIETPGEQIEATNTATPTVEPTPEVVITPTVEPTASAGPIDVTKFTTAFVAGESVNVRAQATTESERITSLPRNTEIKVYKVSGEWAYIGYGDGKKGLYV